MSSHSVGAALAAALATDSGAELAAVLAECVQRQHTPALAARLLQELVEVYHAGVESVGWHAPAERIAKECLFLRAFTQLVPVLLETRSELLEWLRHFLHPAVDSVGVATDFVDAAAAWVSAMFLDPLVSPAAADTRHHLALYLVEVYMDTGAFIGDTGATAEHEEHMRVVRLNLRNVIANSRRGGAVVAAVLERLPAAPDALHSLRMLRFLAAVLSADVMNSPLLDYSAVWDALVPYVADLAAAPAGSTVVSVPSGAGDSTPLLEAAVACLQVLQYTVSDPRPHLVSLFVLLCSVCGTPGGVRLLRLLYLRFPLTLARWRANPGDLSFYNHLSQYAAAALHEALALVSDAFATGRWDAGELTAQATPVLARATLHPNWLVYRDSAGELRDCPPATNMPFPYLDQWEETVSTDTELHMLRVLAQLFSHPSGEVSDHDGPLTAVLSTSNPLSVGAATQAQYFERELLLLNAEHLLLRLKKQQHDEWLVQAHLRMAHMQQTIAGLEARIQVLQQQSLPDSQSETCAHALVAARQEAAEWQERHLAVYLQAQDLQLATEVLAATNQRLQHQVEVLTDASGPSQIQIAKLTERVAALQSPVLPATSRTTTPRALVASLASLPPGVVEALATQVRVMELEAENAQLREALVHAREKPDAPGPASEPRHLNYLKMVQLYEMKLQDLQETTARYAALVEEKNERIVGLSVLRPISIPAMQVPPSPGTATPGAVPRDESYFAMPMLGVDMRRASSTSSSSDVPVGTPASTPGNTTPVRPEFRGRGGLQRRGLRM